jgi:hypothetical protein
MIKWDALLREIRLLILRTFCTDIIDEFKCLSTSVWDDGSFLDDDSGLPLAWPPCTSCSQIVHGCHHTLSLEFNYIIMHQVKFDGISPVDVKDGSLLGCVVKCTLSRCHVPFVYRATGCFWKNVSIVTNVYAMSMALLASATRSYQMFLPHIESVLCSLV